MQRTPNRGAELTVVVPYLLYGVCSQRNLMPSLAIGVDLGGTNLRVSAIDEAGKQLETITTGTEVSRGPNEVIREMSSAIVSLETKFRTHGRLLGIGIGV